MPRDLKYLSGLCRGDPLSAAEIKGRATYLAGPMHDVRKVTSLGASFPFEHETKKTGLDG